MYLIIAFDVHDIKEIMKNKDKKGIK